jgi:23S rRNA G2445 N2-methylase RlmL
MIARNMAPGLYRERFGCERWPGHDAKLGEKLRAQARAAATPSKTRLIGRDLDAKTIEGAKENLRAAGLADAVELEHGNALVFEPRKGWGAWIVSNPPWGERIGEDRDVARLYREFGSWLRQNAAGFHVALLVQSGAISHELGLKSAESTRVLNGGIDCTILRADV